MAISDVLFEAEVNIKELLETGGYGDSDDPLRQEIEDLLARMEKVRRSPGLDCPPVDELDQCGPVAIQKSFDPHSDDCEASQDWDVQD